MNPEIIPKQEFDLKATDQQWMQYALKLAGQAALLGEVPVGAVVVRHSGQIYEMIAEDYNCKESNNDPLGHAEIRAIRKASQALGRWRLSDCTLYVTLEPCTMCAGALIQARMGRVVYAAKDAKAGAVESISQVLNDIRLNHRPEVLGGVMAEESCTLLQSFFKKLRVAPVQKNQ